MRKHKIFRRIAIIALSLGIVANSVVAVSAAQSSEKNPPKVTVGSYWELVSAVQTAESGDVIGFTGTIAIEAGTELGTNGRIITLRRMEKEATLILSEGDGQSVFQNIIFDGNSTSVGGTEPLIQSGSNALFSICTFKDCLNQGGNGGAIYMSGRNLQLNSCTFSGNSATNGSHIYNTSDWSLVIENSTFKDGWADEAGGAIYLTSDSCTYISGSKIYDNHSRVGGGLYNAGYLDLTKTLVYKNEATIQGTDIATERSASFFDYGTEEIYNSLLRTEGLYFTGWEEDTNHNVGFNGKCLKFGYTDTDPNVTPPQEGNREEDDGGDSSDPKEEEGTEPTDPTDPTDPPEGGDTDGGEDNPTEGDGEQSGDDEGGSENEKEDDPDDPTESDGGNNDPTGGETEPPKDDENSEGGEEPTPPIDEDNEQTDDKDNGSVAGGSNDSHDTTISGSGNTEGSYNTDDHSTSNSGNTDSHNTDDHSIVDNSSHDTSITDNSDHSSSTENSGNTSTITDSHNDNSTSNSGNTSTATDSHDDNSISNSSNTSNVSNTDNSVFSYDASTYDNSSHNSTYFEDNSYSDSSSTYSYYYESHTEQGGSYAVEIVEMPQYAAVDGSGGSQPVNVTVPVTINTAGVENGYNGSTAAPAQNIKIQAEGVNVVYEYTAEGVSISISTPKAVVTAETEALALPRAYSPTISNQEPERADQGSAQDYNWIEIVSMILLALLVLGEMRDKFKKTA